MIKTIALIGASGNVGRSILSYLTKKNLNLRLFASNKSQGKTLQIDKKIFLLESLDSYDFKDSNIAIFATDADISKQYIPQALATQTRVIDSSSYYRLDKKVPLIVPPVNLNCVNTKNLLYATANCVASPLAMVLKPLLDSFGIKRVYASTYQSTSGAGKKPMDELLLQTQKILDKENYQTPLFPRQIAFNVIPQIDKWLSSGFTAEENKIMQEVNKILDADINIAVTSVRVPVLVGHAISLFVELKNTFTLDHIQQSLLAQPGIILSEDYHTPVEIIGKDDVFVGRIRKDPTIENGLLLWTVSDNLRRGAATDVCEIVDQLLNHQ